MHGVEAYYTPTGWTPLPPLPHAADDATACVLNGRLYVMGGRNCNKLQVLEISEENGYSWSVKGDLPWAKPCIERYSAGSAVVDSKLWLVGGLVTEEDDEEDEENEEELTAPVSIYDPSLDSWAAGPRLPRAIRACCGAAAHGGEIHVISGGGAFVYRDGAWGASPSAAGHFSCMVAFNSMVLG